jgi:RNA polymerase sigma factor (sigma-70 family)
MSDDLWQEGTTDLLNRYIRGQPEALGPVLARHESRMIQTAAHLIWRLGRIDPAYGPEDAVADAWTKVCEILKNSQVQTIRGSFEFWRRFYTILRREIHAEHKRSTATKRAERQHRQVGDPGEPPLDSLWAHLPPQEALVMAQLEIEDLIAYLEDPQLQEILKLRLREYTVDEIADFLDVSSRTIERRLKEIREVFLRSRRGD